jgi:hypothetical protein
MFKAGDLVRHRNKPEWGIGRVTGQTVEGKVLVKFSARAGDVLLTPEGAGKFLTPETDATWQSAPRAAVRPETPVGRVPCPTCARDLRDSFLAANGEWKVCPSCSVRNGRQHVFRAWPRAFEGPGPSPSDTAAPESSTPDEKAEWCASCRANGRIPAGPQRVCADVWR